MPTLKPRLLANIIRIIEAEEHVAKSYKRLKKAMEQARRHKKIANRLKKRCFRLGNPKVSTKIYQSGTIKNENHGLIKLPVEVKKIIFKALPTAADRACLGLACKDQAAVYDQLKTEKNKKDYAQHVPKRATDVHRLQMLIRLKPDMPAKYRICYLCLQFIDTTHPDNAGLWGGSENRVSGGKTTKTAMIEGPRCPLCVAAKKLEAAKYKDTYKKYLALVDKVSFK
ncbi:hypothetical protein A1O7_10171 [Cladophialophora yegresii CBS 114405]|uniref:F-box domain-containing protein n=1 Tax=Cladophialophora yegresii CBS 114405 TaxID=1182544 RepID=W9VPA3_9EURO|nr:uncharacterized protein A1O7_10171 [Cladophialophora yegresii CBS 114405]EXJ54830.1 hypothetical protein A1O7_10171 [Cladophialophora yegresii CBS 114405]